MDMFFLAGRILRTKNDKQIGKMTIVSRKIMNIDISHKVIVLGVLCYAIYLKSEICEHLLRKYSFCVSEYCC